MSNLFTAGKFKELDSNGNPAEGYLVYVFLANSTTKTTTYQEFSQDTENTNPIVLDARGEANIWLPSNQSYKVTFTTPDDNLPLNDPYPTDGGIWTVDDVQGGMSFTTETIIGNRTLTVNDNGKILLADASLSNIVITPPAVADAGAQWIVYVIRIDSSGNTVTFDPLGATPVDGQTTYPFTRQYQSASFISSGTEFYTLNNTNTRALLDTNNNIALDTTAATNPAANNYTVYAASGGNSPTLETIGSDTNIRAKIKGKGNRGLLVSNGSDTTLLQIDDSGTTLTSPITSNCISSSSGTDSRTNTVTNAFTVTQVTSGTPAAGIGTGILLQAESADETPSNVGALQFANSNVTAGSEATYLSVLIRRAGAALAEAYRWTSTGTFKLIQTFAGTADRTITYPDCDLSHFYVNGSFNSSSTAGSTTSTIPVDNTIPQNTEGTQYFSVAYTPTNANNILEIESTVNLSDLSGVLGVTQATYALFSSASANALAAMKVSISQTSGHSVIVTVKHTMAAGTTSALTFSTRYGPSTAVSTAIGAAVYGAITRSTFIIKEFTP